MTARKVWKRVLCNIKTKEPAGREVKNHLRLPKMTRHNSRRATKSNRPMTKSSKRKSEDKRPPAPRGRPPKRVVKIYDSPRNIACFSFAIRSTRYPRPDQ